MNPNDIKVPFVLNCQVTGKTVAYTAKDYVLRKINNYGGEQKMRDGYVCSEAKKLLKAGKTAAEVITILNGTLDPVEVQKKLDSGILFLQKKVGKRAKPAAAPQVDPGDQVPAAAPAVPEATPATQPDAAAPVPEAAPVVTETTPEATPAPQVEPDAKPAAAKKKHSSKHKKVEEPASNPQ